MFFMPYAAPAHYASDARAWLDENFRAGWIDCRRSTDRSARSPDLTMTDFFL